MSEAVPPRGADGGLSPQGGDSGPARRNPAHPERERPPSATILVAEDHPDSRDALRTLLEALGYRVVLAGNGRDAVQAALSVSPDLVLMDIMMPELDGLDATRALRSSREFRQVPILALTAMEGARESALAAGCDDHVAKPLDVRSFLEKVERWVEAGRALPS